MIYTLGKMLCTKMLQVSSGIPPLLQACVPSQEATILLQGKTQAHLKTYQPQGKKSEDEYYSLQSSDMQTLKANCKQFDNKNNQVQY